MNMINEEEDDDWENVKIPVLISERERKILEERQKVEEADNILSQELFLSGKKIEYKMDNEITINKKHVNLNLQKPKCLENRRQKLIENQKEKSELLKRKKAEQLRLKEIYGDAELDEYDELYGSIQDNY